MARQPVQSIPLSAQLRPVAQTVDTYVKPAQSPLRGLADALATTDGAVRQYLNTRDEKAEQEAAIKGKAAFYSERSGEIAQALTDGKIPAHYSPFYVRGFKNAQGAAAGDTLRSKWQDAWDNWEDKNNEDPEAFNKFFRGFVASSVGTEDPDVLRGVLPAVEALQQNATTQYTQYRHDRTVNGNLNAHGALISSGVQRGIDAGLVSDKGTDYGAIFTNVNNVVAESLAKGDPGGKAIGTFIDVMSAKILESKDPELLRWFDEKVPGQSYTYGETPKGLEAKNSTVNALETIARQQAAGLSAAERQQMEKLKDAAQSDIIKGILANPDAPIDENLLTQAEHNGDPLIRLHAKQWRDDLVKGTSDPKKLGIFYDEVMSGRKPPKAALMEALSAGVFGSAEDMRAASSFVQSFQTSEDAITRSLDGRIVSTLLSTIKERTSSSEDLMNPLTGFTDEGLEASADLRQLVTRWIINNPNATQYEIDEQSTRFGKQILGSLTSPEFGQSAEYNRDPNLPFSNPYAEQDASTQPGQQQQQDGGSTKPPAQGSGSSDPEVRAWEKANNITPAHRQRIMDQAEKEGMGYDEMVRERALGKPSSSLLKPISYNPGTPDVGGEVEDVEPAGRSSGGITPEQAAGYIDKAFQQATQAGMSDEDRTTALLDLIGQGESNGNYNAVYGNPGNARDLSAFSVDDILGFQQQARQRGIPSTAIGKYQFIQQTLRGLKAEMGLSGSEKFSPQLQDKMGVALLNRRGLQAYRNGRITKGTFALSLSKEFAALPHPGTGMSYYQGDGLNKSRVPRSAVYSALGFSPASYGNRTAAGGGGRGAGLLTFNNPGQEAGIQPQLRAAVEGVAGEMGRRFTVLSGHRSANHPAERNKKSGGGQHTHGNAMDLDMSGMDDRQKADLVQRLIGKGVKRFITYDRSPDMLHIDLKDQNGNGQPHFMHNKSAKNLAKAPLWLREIALGTSS